MMLTRCPNCSTAFRVSAEQLKVRQGQVRCGQCRQVFNALTSLVDEPTAMAPGEAQPQPDPVSPAEQTAPLESAPAQVPAGETPLPPEAEPPAAEAPTAHLDEVFAALSYRRSQRGRAWAWGGAAFLAACLVLLQALLHFRVELSQSFPVADSLLQEAAAALGMDSSLPHKADLLAIETSDLHPGSGAQLVLAATIKNRAPFAQAYPHLELTLTDLSDQALLRKVLAPSDYLPAGIDAGSGFAASSEFAFDLTLEASVADAAGYRIYLFYP